MKRRRFFATLAAAIGLPALLKAKSVEAAPPPSLWDPNKFADTSDLVDGSDYKAYFVHTRRAGKYQMERVTFSFESPPDAGDPPGTFR